MMRAFDSAADGRAFDLLSSAPLRGVFKFGNLRLAVACEDEALAADIGRVYRHARTAATGGYDLVVHVAVRLAHLDVHLLEPGCTALRSASIRAPTLDGIESEINYVLLSRLNEHLPIHGGAVVFPGNGDGQRAGCGAENAGRDGDPANHERPRGAILLPASSGRGKSTLVGMLVRRGFGYLTEELVLMCPRTLRIAPFPKLIRVKRGSFPLFAGLTCAMESALATAETRYVDPETLHAGALVHEPSTVRRVIFPHFRPGAETRSAPMAPAEATMRLFQNACHLDRHGPDGFDALVRLARLPHAVELTFGDANEACMEIARLA